MMKTIELLKRIYNKNTLSSVFLVGGLTQLPYAMYANIINPNFDPTGTVLIAITFFSVAIYLKIPQQSNQRVTNS